MKKYRYLLPVSAALLLAACVGGSGGTSPDFVAGAMAKAHGDLSHHHPDLSGNRPVRGDAQLRGRVPLHGGR